MNEGKLDTLFIPVFGATKNSIWYWDIATGSCRYSPLLDDKFEEIIVTDEEWGGKIHPDDKVSSERIIRQALKNKDDFYEIEYRVRAREGKWRWIFGKGKTVERDVGGYPSVILGTCIDITMRKNMEDSLVKRERYLSALEKAGQTLLPSFSEVSYDSYLEALGPASNASRVYVFYNYRDAQGKLRMDQQAEWCAPNIEPQLGNPLLQDSIYEDVYPRWEAILSKGGNIRGRVADFPEVERMNLAVQNIKAILVLPIIVDDQFVGYIGFDNCINDRPWDQMELEFLSTSTSYLTQVIKRERALNALKESESKLRTLSAHLIKVQEDERKRISRELHDELGQSMTLLKLQLDSIFRQIDTDLLKENCTYAMNFVDQIIENVRSLSRDLSPPILEGLGLCAALKWQINRFKQHSNIEVDFNLDNINSCFNDDGKILIYRIIQEILTNAGKHAQASHVEINIQKRKDCVFFCVKDDGVGFDLDKIQACGPLKKGMGLSTINERVSMLDGEIEFVTQINQGTVINVSIPINCGGE